MLKLKKISIFLLTILPCCTFNLSGVSVYSKENNSIKYFYNNIYELKEAELKKGDIVLTKGYNEKNDNGGAVYKIVDYEEFYNDLPKDIKAVAYRGDRWGLGNPVFEKNSCR